MLDPNRACLDRHVGLRVHVGPRLGAIMILFGEPAVVSTRMGRIAGNVRDCLCVADRSGLIGVFGLREQGALCGGGAGLSAAAPAQDEREPDR
jgi:hypothetical protein